MFVAFPLLVFDTKHQDSNLRSCSAGRSAKLNSYRKATTFTDSYNDEAAAERCMRQSWVQ